MTNEPRDDQETTAATADGANGPLADEALVVGEIAALQAQLSDASEKQMRLAADFDNYRKRVVRERAEQVARAQATLLKRLLDVLDDLERVTQHADPKSSTQAIAQGVELVERKFRQALEAEGVELVEAENARFDPQTMEAVASVATDDPASDDTVSDVFQRGYRFNGVLLRPARVRVRKFD